MILEVKVEDKSYDFNTLTEDELNVSMYLYESKKPVDVYAFRKMIFSKCIGTSSLDSDANLSQELKDLVDRTPLVFHQIFETLAALTGFSFNYEMLDLSKEDLSFLEEKKIDPRRVVKARFIPERVITVNENSELSREECSVLFKRMNQLEYDALRSDTTENPKKAFEILSKLGKDFCIQKDKAEKLASLYPAYFLKMGLMLNECVMAKVSVSIKK